MVSTKKSDIASVNKVYLFTGEIDSRRDAEIDRTIKSAVNPDFEVFDLERFNGDAVSGSDILAAVSTVPMASERKVVIVDRIERLSAGDQSKLAKTLPHLSDRSCLVLMCSDNSKPKRIKKEDEKSRANQKASQETDEEEITEGEDEAETGKTARKSQKGLTTELSNAVKANGKVINFPRMKAGDLAPILAGLVERTGKGIAPPALQALVRSLQLNPALAEKEIEKLATYIGDRKTITAEDVEKLIEKPDEDRVFPLIDAIAAAQPALAVQLLNETFAASLKPDQDVLKTVSLLGRHFRLLYQANYLLAESGVVSDRTPEQFRQRLMREQNPLSMADWQREKLTAQARHFSMKELQHCMKLTLKCELAAKGIGKIGGTPRLNLEMLIYKLSQRRPSKR